MDSVYKAHVLNNYELVAIDYDDKKILVTIIPNKIYATDRIYTHVYADPSIVFLNGEEKTITCPLLFSRFELEIVIS